MANQELCARCGGKCCRYFALPIDTPKTRRDFDDVRWYLCHEGTMVYVEEGEWYLEVRTVCRHLDERNRCRIYEHRPAVCREHSPDDCEGRANAEFDHEHEFHNDEELGRYIAQRFGRRKAKRPSKKGAAEKAKKGRRKRKG